MHDVVGLNAEYAVFVFSYGSIMPGRNARATDANMSLAIEIVISWLHDATIFISGCQHDEEHPFPLAWKNELALKITALKSAKITRVVSGGQIDNTVREIMNWKKEIVARDMKPGAIVLVTCELHSKSVKMAAEKFFPGIPVFVLCNPHEYEVQPDHPTPAQRNWWSWLIASWLRFIAFKAASWGLVSFEWLAGRKHRYE